MLLTKEQIATAERVGRATSGDVFECTANGGLVIIEIRKSSGKKEILGVGPHRGIARYIAECNDPSIKFTDLQKSQSILGADDVRYSIALTRRFQAVK